MNDLICTHLGRNSWPTIASNTELFPELWLPITTILGSFRVSLWSILSNMVRISINLRVRCISPFCWGSERDLSESEGDDTVAPTRAAIIASSPSGFLEDLFDPVSVLLLPLSSELSLAENKSLRNSGASNEGNWTADAAAESDLKPSEAVSKASAAVSLAVLIQACDFNLSSVHQNENVRQLNVKEQGITYLRTYN